MRAQQGAAEFDAAFQAHYNTPGEAAGGGGGGAGAGGSGEGGGHDDPFDRSRPANLGGDRGARASPGGHQNDPAFIPADADRPNAGTGSREELFDMSGKPVGPAIEYLPYVPPSAKQLRDTSLSGGRTAPPRGRPTDHDIDAASGRGRYVRDAYTRDRRQHHVLPREHRRFFRARGIAIDNFCISLSDADHQAIHRLDSTNGGTCGSPTTPTPPPGRHGLRGTVA